MKSILFSILQRPGMGGGNGFGIKQSGSNYIGKGYFNKKCLFSTLQRLGIGGWNGFGIKQSGSNYIGKVKGILVKSTFFLYFSAHE